MKRFVLIACAAALLAPVAANAELQLWFPTTSRASTPTRRSKYRDARALLTKAHTETCNEYRLAFTMDSAGLTHMALGEYPEAESASTPL